MFPTFPVEACRPTPAFRRWAFPYAPNFPETRRAELRFRVMPAEELISKMRHRIEQCRRLAGYVTDEHTKRVLNQMAQEAEADLHKFEADSGQDNERREG